MQFASSILNKYVGNQQVFANKYVLGLLEKHPKLAFLNDGMKPPEKIDLNQSASLCATGTIWTYYATLIQPQNAGTRALAACNFAMACCHGYNTYRRVNYNKSIESPSS
eukprot:gene13009-15301_t